MRSGAGGRGRRRRRRCCPRPGRCRSVPTSVRGGCAPWTSRGAARRRRSWPSRRARPASPARGTRWSRPGRPPRCATGAATPARGRHRLVPEARLGDAVGGAEEVDGTVDEVGQHHRRGGGVVTDQVALGDRPAPARGPGTGPCRGWSGAGCARRGASRPCRRGRRARRARRASVGPSWRDRSSSPRARPRPRRWCARTSPSGGAPPGPSPAPPPRRASSAAASRARCSGCG